MTQTNDQALPQARAERDAHLARFRGREQVLATLLREQEITVLQMVPSALRALLAEPHFAAGALRHVICGGEALDHTLAQTLLQRLPNATLGNFYGPTENSIDATQPSMSQ